MNDKKIIEIKVIGKRKKENTVYIAEKLFIKSVKTFNKNVSKSLKGKESLYSFVKESPDSYLFQHHENKPYRREYVSDEISKAGKLIDRDISAHTLRHSKAMYMLNDRNISIDKIQKALNHSSAGTTMAFYLHGKATPEEMGIK